MRVDVVAAPMRYRRMPLVILLVIAVVPAFGLFAATRWLDSEADKYESSRDAAALLEPDVPANTVEEEPAPESGVGAQANERRAILATSLFDYRRLPQPIADQANARRLSDTVSPLFGFLNDDSCAAVSVNGIPVASANADSVVIPASTQKLVIAAVALEILGPDYTFETTVRIPTATDGVIDGDVFLVGGGDPVLTADDYPIEDDPYPAFATTSLDVLADAFVASGIERINGTVIADGNRYDDEFVIDGWGDGVAFDSAGPYDALLVNDARALGRNGVQDDPNVAAAREFVRLLGNRNVRVTNGWGSGQASTTSTIIGTVKSAPLSEIIREMLTNSDNNTAEMLVKELGVAGSGEGTRAAGLTLIDQTLRSWDVPMDGVRVLDGSGLHLGNRMTCAALLSVVQRSRGTAVSTGLPVAAESGTLRDEFVDSPMAGTLFAKTGTLGNPPIDEPPLAAKALAGYVATENGNTIEFVLIINDAEILDETYRSLWAAFGERFSTYPEGPAVDTLGPE